jgi:hypothetical protein
LTVLNSSEHLWSKYFEGLQRCPVQPRRRITTSCVWIITLQNSDRLLIAPNSLRVYISLFPMLPINSARLPSIRARCRWHFSWIRYTWSPFFSLGADQSRYWERIFRMTCHPPNYTYKTRIACRRHRGEMRFRLLLHCWASRDVFDEFLLPSFCAVFHWQLHNCRAVNR